VTSQKTPEETTHRDFYESFVYEKYLRHQEWNIKLFPSMVNDEVFLMRHVNAQSRSGCTALMYAARYSKEEEVKLLLASGADVNLSNNAQYTALMNAANNSTIKIVKLLLDAGADVNRKNYEGGTALFSACFAAQEKIIKLLISTGADINIRDNCNHTALSYTTNKKIRALLTPS
jgi:ankyrin repeat protein